MPRVANSAFVSMFSYYPPSGGQGISLGLVRQDRCAFGAHPGGVGTPPPRSIALGSKNPRLYLLPRGASVRFVFVSVSGLLACSRSHVSAAPFGFVPRLFVPPCMQIQMRVYSTAFPVFPTCWIFPSFSNAERYRVAVASETCRSFSTSSLVILPFTVSASRILSNFFRFLS